MATTTSPGTSRAIRAGRLDAIVLALLAYVPFLLSSPGRVSADSKQYLYLDPSLFLSRAAEMWDEHMGAGTVSHQHIGYLFPMGPWFWLTERLGLPVWVAQRLWLGSLSLAAVLGARWFLRRLGLSRAGALAGALVYLLTPYQLAFTARTSVLLLPWAGLPWLMGLADRAVARRGWRDSALIALVLLTIGAVNASSLLLIGVGPALWILTTVVDRATLARAAAVAGQVALLGVGVSLWWMAGLRLEGTYGLPVLQVTENLASVAATSSPLDVLRGLGNWYFYGRDRLGYSIDQAASYLTDDVTMAATFLVPALGLAAALVVRWRHRGRLVALVLVGTVVAVGAWPLDDPSPLAEGAARFMDSSAGLALRNTARAVPVVILGLAGLIGAAVSAWRPPALRWGTAAAVALVALVGLKPVAETGFLTDAMDRVDPVPAYWYEIAADLDAAGPATRVLEIPGSNFAAYRWGNAVDPILPGLMDRGHLAREVLPQGSASSALLLDALDRRIQEGVLEPDSLAPVARLLGAGTVVLRSDLQWERFRTPNPRALWQLLTGRPVAGLDGPVGYGEPTPNVPVPSLPMVDEVSLRTGAAPDPPPAARFEVQDPVGLVRTAPLGRPVVVAGDGDGIVDSAAAGLIDGHAHVLGATTTGDDVLADALAEGADLVVTDTYRQRIQTWFYAIRDTRGPTEVSGRREVEPSGYDHRLDASPEAGDDERTVVEQIGGQVWASGGGGAGRPEDRAAVAVDGDLQTAWRVGGAAPTGHRIVLEAPAPVAAAEVVLVQPQDGPRDRVLTEVRVSFDGGAPVTVALGPDSLEPAGQAVPVPGGLAQRVEIEISGVSAPPFDPALANAVGFAEVRLGDTRVVERVRVPTALLDRADAGGHGLDVVLTRLRYEPGARGRQDQERSLQRFFELPRARAFGLSGLLRVEPNAPDPVLDEVLGTTITAGAAVDASSHLLGDVGSRASRAVDGDPATGWRPQVGPQDGQRLTIELPSPTAVGVVSVLLGRGAHTSVPTSLRLEADGRPVAEVAVPEPSEDDGPVAVALPAPSGPVARLELVVDGVERVTPRPGDPNDAETLPVEVLEVTGSGLPTAQDGTAVDPTCRPLLRIDDTVVPVRAVGAPSDARRGLALQPCGPVPALDMAAGPHVLSSVSGLETGLDVDRLVLSSDPAGAATTVAVRGAPRSSGGATATLESTGGGDVVARVDTDGQPFWFTLGQSDDQGWQLSVEGAAVGPREIVDGFANGWLIDPLEPGPLVIEARWSPQRTVWMALAASALFVVACGAILLVGRGRGRATAPRDPGPDTDGPRFALAGHRLERRWGHAAAPAAVGGAVLLAATPTAAALAAGATALGLVVPVPRVLLAGLAGGGVMAAWWVDRPRWAWVALAFVLADLVVEGISRRGRRSPGGRAASAG